MTTSPEPHSQVGFMPWADISRPIQIGRVTFLPCQEAIEAMRDAETRDHLRKYFQRYVDAVGRPTNSATVCSVRDDCLRPVTEADWSSIKDARNALAFVVVGGAVLDHLIGHGAEAPCSNRFELKAQNFRPGEHHIAVAAGRHLSGGFSMDEILFQRPMPVAAATPSLFMARAPGALPHPHERWIGALHAFLSDSRSQKEELYRRLRRSLEWFFLAHFEVDQGDQEHMNRVVLMATAFETLFNLKGNGKALNLAHQVDGALRSCYSVLERRTIGPENKPECVELSRGGWWAYDFYKLRNDIVHGDEVHSNHLSIANRLQADVAACVFWECVLRHLMNGGWCLLDDRRRAAEALRSIGLDVHAAEWMSMRDSWMLGTRAIYESLEWLDTPTVGPVADNEPRPGALLEEERHE